jgi:hypothetical protein
MNELSEYYQALKERVVSKPLKKVHKGNWSLYYFIGQTRFLAVENKPYALLVKKQKELSGQIQYKTATFKIVPYETK